MNVGEKTKGRSSVRVLSGVLSVLLLLDITCQITMPSVKAEAEQVFEESIVSQAGNSRMKELGEAVENKTKILQVEDQIINTKGTIYYVDSVDGSDTNNGTSRETAWKSIEKVNEMTYSEGDTILFKAGCKWQDTTLKPKGSGTHGNPILISSYGEGEMPKLAGNGKIEDVIFLKNQQYFEISNLDISNTVQGFMGVRNSENGSKLNDFRGIHVLGQDGGMLKNYYFHDLYVHDVTGDVCWVSGGYVDVEPGIRKGRGWDLAKRTGGIIFEVLDPETTDPTIFDGITIEDSIINNNSFGGIVIKQWIGDDNTGLHWGSREEGKGNAPTYECANWAPHTNVTIRNNYLSQAGTDYGCDTILLMSVKNGMVEHNVSRKAGICGVEMCSTDSISVQYNEIYDTCSKAGGADSAGIDPDKMATNALIQYNYIHETGDGILLCGFVFGSSVSRYNVVKDAEKRYVNLHGDKGVNYLYNNIFYNTKEKHEGKSIVPFIASSGGDNYLSKRGNMHYIYNNIFYNTAPTSLSALLAEGSATEYDSNCYYGEGVNPPSQDTNPFTADPRFLDKLNTDVTACEELNKLQLKASSPLINAGRLVKDDPNLTIVGNGGTDFFGQPLYLGGPDIGAAEYQGMDGKSIIHGYVKDEYGVRISGAKVIIDGLNVMTETDENGYYALTGLDAGEYTIFASKDLYEDGENRIVLLESNMAVNQELTLGTCQASEGSLTGTVKNAKGGIYQAVVEIRSISGEYRQQTVTEADGTFVFDNVSIGQDYQISAAKEGYETTQIDGVSVRPGAVTSIVLTLTKRITDTVYALNVNFDDFETGAFAENDEWKAIAPDESIGKVTIIEDPDRSGNKYLQLLKTASGNIAFYNKDNVGLTGVVTMEARVKRTVQGNKNNQFGLYSYNESGWNKSEPWKSSGPMGTFALTGGKIISHNVMNGTGTIDAGGYSLNEWHVIRNVMNLDLGTFDLYIDDMNLPVLMDQPLRTIKDEVGRFLFFSSSSHLGDLCIDYFRVCQGIPYDYNDASLVEIQSEDLKLTASGSGYKGEVPAEVTSIKILPVASSIFAEVSVNGSIITKEQPVDITLKEGNNEIMVKVIAEDGVTEKEYKVEIYREIMASQAYLLSLGIDETFISPEFEKEVENYSASVDNAIEKIHLNYQKVNEMSFEEIKVNGIIQGTQREVTLLEGDNIIEIRVGSEDGTNYKTYTILVNRLSVQSPVS